MPTAQSDRRSLEVDARCVRLNAKAETPAAVVPSVEQRPLSCGENQVLIEIKAASRHGVACCTVACM
jgi:NADPH2:quinone reductase